ncbi:hypothetical protein B0H15DRAFT_253542 [Mycena belliarum]|uniref:Uncharacterized protein n=1 Tax=Mycena belliarum TaxID=1033014 RepID=A0AAD6U4A8_9AGAR|nr:hypothetical protein B0H15DRAFT_253542 [Mycena belliae]
MSTMLDTHVDAHMADYNPIDIEMHQPAEPWFGTEAKMEDDAALESRFTDHASTLSVEVDMEDHYGDNEYEMGDDEGDEIFEEMSSDLLDIEVYSASEPLEDATIPLTEHMDPSQSLSPDASTLSAPIANPSILPFTSTPAMSPLPPSDAELPDASVPEPAEIVEEVLLENSTAEHLAGPPVELVAPLPTDEEENVESTHESQNEYQNDSGEAQEQGETGNLQESRSEADVAQPQEQNELSDPAVSESQEVEEPAVDPHEISEGVYIDPPPAVFVSFDSPDCPDVCLFNQPAGSRSPSPSAEGHGHGYQVFSLLLRHRPILYYEPIASVFEALRQEDHLRIIPQLADSELVLDAYDLQLVISEDNVYAREVTLHDLNVLHDGSDIAGPLRLRLKATVPRFILRYHLLQDQVARFHLLSTGDEQDPSVEPSRAQQEDPHSDEDNNEEEDTPEVCETATELPADLRNAESDSAAQDQRDRRQDEHDLGGTEPRETESEPPEPDIAREQNLNGDEYIQPHEEGDGEKSQRDPIDNADRLPELPEEEEEAAEEEAAAVEEEEEEEEEEEFVVVDTPGAGAKPTIPLTGTAVDSTGKGMTKTASDPPLSSPSHDVEDHLTLTH